MAKLKILLLITVCMTSCSLSNNLTDSEYMRRAEIQKNIDMLQADYYYKLDSLYIEYYKEDK